MQRRTIETAWQNPSLYSTTFGAEGSYYDHITDILTNDPSTLTLINLSITDQEIYSIMQTSGFTGHKLDHHRHPDHASPCKLTAI